MVDDTEPGGDALRQMGLATPEITLKSEDRAGREMGAELASDLEGVFR